MTRLLLATVAALLAACTQPENARVQVLIGGTLLDGAGSPPLERSVIIVEDGKFSAVGSQVHTPIPTGSKKIDTTGLTIRPAAPEGRIAPGQPANLELVSSSGVVTRKMNAGQWQ